jgi:NitT/TauT family transport system substrate-binding protein
MDPIRVGVLGRLNAGPTLVALGRGYFAEQGLAVDAVDVAGDTGMTMLAEGQLDAGALRPSLYFYRAWRADRPMALVADQGRYVAGRPGGAIVARPSLIEEGALRDYADLRGKRIGLSPDKGDHDWLTIAAALRRGGLSWDDVEVVECDYGALRHQALAAGTIDVSTVSKAASIAEGRAAGAYLPFKFENDVEDGNQQWAVMFGPTLRLDRRDLTVSYLTAYLRGARDYYDAFEHGKDRDSIIQILAEQAGVSAESVAKASPLGFDPDGYLNVEGIAADLAWMKEAGSLPQTVPLEGVVDQSYLEAALDELGRYQRA